ncbi:putative zinc finger protein, partial [Orchesella cincta]
NGKPLTINEEKKKRRPAELPDHITVHSVAGSETYQCNICGNRYRTKANFKNHLSCKTGIKLFNCDKCESSFNSLSHLKYHLRGHLGLRPFPLSFDRHVNQVHGNIRRYKCEHCPQEFYSKYSVKVHLVSHTGERPFVCQECNQRFKYASALRKHSFSHDTHRFMCYKCDMAFPTLIDFEEHLRHHNITLRPYRFTRPDNLRRHEKMCEQAVNVDGDVINIGRQQIEHDVDVGTEQLYQPVERVKVPAENEVAGAYKVPEIAEDLNPTRLESSTISANAGEYFYQCRMCSQCFNRLELLQSHLVSTHELSPDVSKILQNEGVNDLEPPSPQQSQLMKNTSTQTTGVFVLLVPIPVFIPVPTTFVSTTYATT